MLFLRSRHCEPNSKILATIVEPRIQDKITPPVRITLHHLKVRYFQFVFDVNKSHLLEQFRVLWKDCLSQYECFLAAKQSQPKMCVLGF